MIARIVDLYLEDFCRRRMADYLAREGIQISRDRVHKLICWMSLLAIYQNPTTVSGDLTERSPWLVDIWRVTTVDQVWALDITSRCARCCTAQILRRKIVAEIIYLACSSRIPAARAMSFAVSGEILSLNL